MRDREHVLAEFGHDVRRYVIRRARQFGLASVLVRCNDRHTGSIETLTFHILFLCRLGSYLYARNGIAVLDNAYHKVIDIRRGHHRSDHTRITVLIAVTVVFELEFNDVRLIGIYVYYPEIDFRPVCEILHVLFAVRRARTG